MIVEAKNILIVNAKNICGNAQDFLMNCEKRESVCALAEILGAYILLGEMGKKIYPTITLITKVGKDMQFIFAEKDRDKAQKLYDFVAECMENGVEYIKIDALEWGAL